MLPGINAGLSGLQSNSRRLGVAGGNIANINTPSFKKLEFSDKSALNSGVRRSSMQGATYPTGNQLDLSINGEGFFRVTTPDGNSGFTRRGIFSKDRTGRLVDANGNSLSPEIVVPHGASSISVSANGKVTAHVGGKETDLGRIEITTFNNPGGLTESNGLYFESPVSGQAVSGSPGTGAGGAQGSIAVGTLESSNVDIAEEIVNMIVAKHGYSANTQVIKASDEILGTTLNIKA
jgi:flagellar basal-body rod protein FlgG